MADDTVMGDEMASLSSIEDDSGDVADARKPDDPRRFVQHSHAECRASGVS